MVINILNGEILKKIFYILFMKKNLSDPLAKDSIFSRLDKLTPAHERQWGKMNVIQMLRHVYEATNMATGKTPVNKTGNLLERTLLKNLILLGMPAPKGKVKTYPEIDVVLKGENPEDINAERDSLKQCIEDFLNFGESHEYFPHPTFGKMTISQWQRLVYIHADYHLEQFGA